MNKIEPKTDSVLEWDEEANQYVLTKAYIKGHYEVNYRNDGVLDARRRKNSRVVYRVLTARLNQSNAPLALWLLNHTEEGRAFMKDILCEQMEADLASGYNDLGSQNPINLATGQSIDRFEIEKNLLCVNADMMVQGVTNYFPFNLFVQYPYPWNVRQAIYGIKG